MDDNINFKLRLSHIKAKIFWKEFWNQLHIILIVTIMVAFIINALMPWFGFNKTDSTDSEEHGRSGLSLHIDNLTKCHYLSTKDGGLYPRMDKNNTHICDGFVHDN